MFAQMLMSSVTPLSDYQPKREAKRKPKTMRYGIRTNVQRHSDTLDKYRSAWKEGDVWLTTREIEKRLGMSKAVASNTLKKWMNEYKILERRPHGEVYNPCRGYEWRWI